MWLEGATTAAQAVKGGAGAHGPPVVLSPTGRTGPDNPPPPLPVRSAAERVPTRAGAHTAHAGGGATQTPAGQPQPAAEAQLQRGPSTQLSCRLDPESGGVWGGGIKWLLTGSPPHHCCSTLLPR